MEHHPTTMQCVWFGVCLAIQCIVVIGACTWSHQQEQKRLNALFPRTKEGEQNER